MENMEIYDVVIKLVGKIEPVGETSEDDRRYENLEVMNDLVGRLLDDIDDVAKGADRQEFSVSKAGKCAKKFLMDN